MSALFLFHLMFQVLDDMATMAYDKVVLGMGNEVGYRSYRSARV